MSALRNARCNASLSQAELGPRMGIDPSIIRHVEAGRLKPYPRFRRVAAEILRVEESELFPDTEETQ